MTPLKNRFKQLLFAAGLMCAAHLPAQAQGMPENGPSMDGPGFMAAGGMPPGFDLPFEHRPGPGFLQGIKLTEEQQDKIFAILHAQQPPLREQMKALRKANEALQAMRFSARYDDGKAKALTDAAGRATATSALLRIRGEQQIYALLTAEQRQQLEDRKEKFKANAGPDSRHAPDPALQQ